MKIFKSEEEYNEYAKSYREWTIIILASLIALMIFIPFLVGFYADVTVMYPYKKRIGAHLENAYDGSTPELMRQELILAKEGMIDEGLKPSDYGKFWWWEQTDDYKMDFTYRYIDGLINRTEFVIQWRNTYINASSSQTLQDVYDEMLDNLRQEYLRNGPIDWGAKPAWILKYATWAYFLELAYLIYIVSMIVGCLDVFYARWWKNPYKEGYWYTYHSLQEAYLRAKGLKQSD